MHDIIQGNCLEVLTQLEDNSIDAIVTDPPYELGFMGKSWDNTGIANNPLMWAECLRVLKPGGHLLAFSGTRTYHRMAVAIEDAGFEVRDMIEWIYSTGFPKSLNIGKAVDKLQGNERESEIVKGKIFTGSNNNINGEAGEYEKTKGTSEWEGWGTALKPAHEPICMARKPLAEPTVAQNCLKWGTGGINIDESRVEGKPRTTHKDRNYTGNKSGEFLGEGLGGLEAEIPSARFPANLIHDNSEEVRECFPEAKGWSSQKHNNFNPYGGNALNKSETTRDGFHEGYNDSGSASRFFKSIITDKLCTLCCLPFDIKHDTMNVCKNTNVSSAEKSLKTTQATTEVIAPQNATTPDNKKFVQSVRSVANLCDLCGTYIAHVLVGGKLVHQEESVLGQVFITEQKKQILDNVLASFVELRGKKDTTPTMNDLNLLFGFVFSAIENSTIYSDKESEVAKNHEWKSLLYQAKASKSERNKGCEELEEKERIDYGGFHSEQGLINNNRNPENRKPTTNNHPTVKPIALMEYLIKMVTPKGGIVLDPFAGSGSTLVAAKQNGFQYVGIELDKDYCIIAESRLKQKTLKQEVLF